MTLQVPAWLRVWRSASAIVVVVLLVGAFVVGWSLRGGGAEQGRMPPPGVGPAATAPQTTAGQTVYTCSMHPQVRLLDPDAKCPICSMSLIPVTEDRQRGERELEMTPEAMKLAEIQTTPVVRMFPMREVRMFGQVDYDETRIATISAYFPGRLEQLFVDYTGISVNRGDHLASVYSPELIVAQEELQQSRAAVQAIRDGSESLRTATQATLEAAREKLRLWGLRDEQIRQLEESDETVEQLTLYSPISGVVIEKKAVVGMYVNTGDPIYEVADLDHLWVRLEAYESQLPWIHYGQDVQFTTDSAPGEVFAGRISFIDPVVSPRTRTVRVRLNVDNSDRRLKPGMFVRAVARSKVASHGLVMSEALVGKWICPMHPEVIKDGAAACDLCGMPLVPIEEMGYSAERGLEPPLVIPATVPLITGKRAVVYVRLPERGQPTFEGREVVLGPRAGEFYIVRSGLREGEAVVTNGAFKIDSALQILAKPSMMSPPGGAPPAVEEHDHGDHGQTSLPMPPAGAASRPHEEGEP